VKIRKDRGTRAVDAELSTLIRAALRHHTAVAHEDSKPDLGLALLRLLALSLFAVQPQGCSVRKRHAHTQ